MSKDYYDPNEDLFGAKPQPKPKAKKFKKREGIQSYQFFKQQWARANPRGSNADCWNEFLKYLREKGCLNPKLESQIKN